MLEKMSSDLLSAKLDSLLTIAAGCETFGVDGLRTYLQGLWMAIRKEVCIVHAKFLLFISATFYTDLSVCEPRGGG